MLGKVLVHGLVAATVIGAAAAVYAQGTPNGYLSPEQVQSRGGEDRAGIRGEEPGRKIEGQAQRRERDSNFNRANSNERRGGHHESGHDDDDN